MSSWINYQTFLPNLMRTFFKKHCKFEKSFWQTAEMKIYLQRILASKKDKELGWKYSNWILSSILSFFWRLKLNTDDKAPKSLHIYNKTEEQGGGGHYMDRWDSSQSTWSAATQQGTPPIISLPSGHQHLVWGRVFYIATSQTSQAITSFTSLSILTFITR